jgi:glycerol kinase
LTGGERHVTDLSNASRTLLLNINTGKWDGRLLDLLDIPVAMLPQLRDSSGVVGETRWFGGVPLAVAGVVAYPNAVVFGQRALGAGVASCSFGMGNRVMKCVGNRVRRSKSGLRTTVAWCLEGQIEYALEVDLSVTGGALVWLRDGLRLIHSVAESEELAASIGSSGGVYVVPAFTGLGAPYWDGLARGAVLGISEHTGYRQVVRATLEAIAYQTKEVLVAMENDLDERMKCVRVDGEGVANGFLMQFQADVLGYAVDRPLCTDVGALGVAMLAGLAVGLWSVEDLNPLRQGERVFEPVMPEDVRLNLFEGWRKAVHRTRDWIDS